METRTSVVEDLRIAPNWLGSIIFKTTGAMHLDITNSSATFEISDVKEIGRRCLLMLVTGLSLGLRGDVGILPDSRKLHLV
jgi:hypothetical protein